MARKRQRNVTKERFWRWHLAAWRRSGMTVRGYCAAEGLSQPSFYSWRRLLQQRDPPAQPVKADSEPTVGQAAPDSASPFLPVRLIPDPPSAGAIEVVLRGGRIIRVATGFVARTLREVVTALEDLPC